MYMLACIYIYIENRTYFWLFGAPSSAPRLLDLNGAAVVLIQALEEAVPRLRLSLNLWWNAG